MGLIDMIAAERVAIADDIETLDAAAGTTQSLCSGWTAHQAAAHLIVPFEVRMPAFIKGLITHGFSFDRANLDFAKRIAAERDLPSIAQTLRDNRYHPFTPPGFGLIATLNDVVIHSQDIRRPLGLTRKFESETLSELLGFLTSGKTRGFVPALRIEGLLFEAADAGWRTGTGPRVTGPGEAIAMAVAGRAAALDDLSGDGLATLRDRLRP